MAMFKVGDKVRLTGVASGVPSNAAIRDYIGRTGTVAPTLLGMFYDYVYVEFEAGSEDHYPCLPDELEPVTDAEETTDADV